MQLVLRKRTFHRCHIYWIGSIQNGKFAPYHDIFGPTGYGHEDRKMAMKMLVEIQETTADANGRKSHFAHMISPNLLFEGEEQR